MITLPCRTVFHYEMPRIQTDAHVDELEHWLAVNCKGVWRIYEKGVWFADGKDAMLCKLTWGGA